MTKVFLDSDVILDFLLNREPFSLAAALIVAYAEQKKIATFTSTVSFLNVHYLASSLKGKKEALKLVRQLKKIISLLPVTEATIEAAIAEDTRDLEDTVQFICAQENQMNFVITRNTKDFPKGKLPVVLPDVFLRTVPATLPNEELGAT